MFGNMSLTNDSFSYCTDINRDLHSFPTRRSSDLAKARFRLGEIALANHNLDHAREQFEHALRDSDKLDERERDRKSTRLNSSHANISYAVFCLKKKNIRQTEATVEMKGRIEIPRT